MRMRLLTMMMMGVVLNGVLQAQTAPQRQAQAATSAARPVAYAHYTATLGRARMATETDCVPGHIGHEPP